MLLAHLPVEPRSRARSRRGHRLRASLRVRERIAREVVHRRGGEIEQRGRWERALVAPPEQDARTGTRQARGRRAQPGRAAIGSRRGQHRTREDRVGFGKGGARRDPLARAESACDRASDGEGGAGSPHPSMTRASMLGAERAGRSRHGGRGGSHGGRRDRRERGEDSGDLAGRSRGSDLVERVDDRAHGREAVGGALLHAACEDGGDRLGHLGTALGNRRGTGSEHGAHERHRQGLAPRQLAAQ